jgi:hypothetical protein
MDRRTTLAALGGALPALMLSRSLRAQDEASPITPPVYTLETLQWGTVAKLTSQTALGSTQNQDVIAFAKGEILEQTAVASALPALSARRRRL